MFLESNSGKTKKTLINFIFLLYSIYAFFGISYSSIAKKSLAIGVLLFIVYAIKYEKKYIFNTSFLFILLALLSSILTWTLTKKQIPEVATNSPRAERILIHFAFIPIAYILYENKKRAHLFITIFLLGFILSNWVHGNGLSELTNALNGKRSGLGGHIITMGIIFATIFLYCLIMGSNPNNNRSYSFCLIFLFVYSALGVIISQSRSIYFGLLLAGLLLFTLTAYLSSKSWKKNKHRFYYAILALLLICAFSLLLYHFDRFDIALHKINNEKSILHQLLSREFDKIPRNSAGLRVHFWADAFNWILERPWTGWGESANKHLHTQAGNYFGDRIFHSVHNDLLEILLSHGVLGLSIYATLIIWIYCKVFNLWKTQKIISESFLFFNIFLLFFFFNGLFMSLLYFKETILLWNVVMSYYLAKTLNN